MDEAKAGTWGDTVKRRMAEVIRTWKPEGVAQTFGVTFDGRRLWLVDGATGRLVSMDPETGAVRHELPGLHADAGVASDGESLWVIVRDEILCVSPEDGTVLSRIRLPGGADHSGLAWAEGALWVGQFRGGGVLKVDPESGAVLKRLTSDRLVTGVTWADGGLWHGSEVEPGAREGYEIRRVDPESGEVLDVLQLPDGATCAGLAADADGRFWCGDATTGEVRAVSRSLG